MNDRRKRFSHGGKEILCPRAKVVAHDARWLGSSQPRHYQQGARQLNGTVVSYSAGVEEELDRVIRMMEILASGVSMAEGKVGEVRSMGIMANVMADGDWDDSDTFVYFWQDLGLEAVGIVSCAGEAMSPQKARRE